MKPTLVVLAAGMGSRYGSLKQIDSIGPDNETIMDYSVYDALRAGFGKVVFVIRETFEEDFKTKVTNRFKNQIEVEFVYQEVNTPIEGITNLPERAKPWGTGHAVLVTKNIVNEPFAVVNADDYYGVTSLKLVGDFLRDSADTRTCAMVGFQLNKTLSDNGYVSRGVCVQDDEGMLVDVIERTKIYPEDEKVFFEDGEKKVGIDPKSLVSMNLWGFHPSIFDHFHKHFIRFVEENGHNPKAEFYIPLLVNDMIQSGELTCQVLPSQEKWYGVTYKEDKEEVTKAMLQLSEEGAYPGSLWG
ncbi:MAG: nucleotidyltransferase [Saprospiraceae bacterium]|nr:nucleotidyltransferase [Saprospiraceae bacterium]